MIDAIVGKKGLGKTALLVKEINEKVGVDDSTIVCIEHSRNLDNQVPYEVRLVDITEYPISGPDALMAFLYGMSSRDYDISHIYIDNLLKVFLNNEYKHFTYEEIVEKINSYDLQSFFTDLETYSEKTGSAITMTLSVDSTDLPEAIQSFIRKI